MAEDGGWTGGCLDERVAGQEGGWTGVWLTGGWLDGRVDGREVRGCREGG